MEELSKNNLFNSKSIFNSQSDIPKINTSFFTNNPIGNYNMNSTLNNDDFVFSQRSKNYELVQNMKKNLDHIRLRVTKNMNRLNNK